MINLMTLVDDDDDDITQQDTGRLSGGVTFSRWIGVCKNQNKKYNYFLLTQSNMWAVRLAV